VTPNPKNEPVTRRAFLRNGARFTAIGGLGALAGVLARRSQGKGYVWQIDPAKCVRCGNCATHCVLEQSAVKCVHAYALCGYCQLCTGYFNAEPNELTTAAENQLCPTAAIKRTFVEDPYYEYTIDETLCIGCAKCVEGCNRFGNGSLFLQIRHDRCVNCNECAIARACPGDAFCRVPADQPYLLKTTRAH
jgi:electron transport complex protein RnfB